MVERLSQEEIPIIRFHHLSLWGEFVEKYLKVLGGIYPWDLSGENKKRSEYFIIDFMRVHTNGEVHAREYYEELSLTKDKSGRSELKYLYDLIGLTQTDFDRVLDKRTEVFTKIFARISGDKDSLIILNTEPDGYCNSCVVGLHCKKTILQKIVRSDKDFSYMHILQTLIKQSFGRDSNGVIGKKGGDTMFINGETLFNSEFHKKIEDEYRKMGEKGWMAGAL